MHDPNIHGFILRGEVHAVKMPLAAAPSMREMTDWCGRTQLHVALLRGLPEMVKVMLDVEDLVDVCFGSLVRIRFASGLGQRKHLAFPHASHYNQLT